MAEYLDLSELPNTIGVDGSVRHEWRGTVNGVTPEALAHFFHDRYEALAPEYGYETRRESSVPGRAFHLRTKHSCALSLGRPSGSSTRAEGGPDG